MLLRYKREVVAVFIAFLLRVGETPIKRRHCVQQSPRIDEGQQGNTLPGHPLPVHVDPERARIKVDNWGRFLSHQLVEYFRYMLSTRRWENAHELLEWLGRPPHIKLDVHVPYVDEVGSEGCKMIWIVPMPGRRSLVIVLQNPSHTFHIMLGDLFPKLDVPILNAELLTIITLLVPCTLR